MRQCQKKKRDQVKQDEQKTQMQQMAESEETNWLDAWPQTMQEEVRGQADAAEAYEMITRMSEDKVEE